MHTCFPRDYATSAKGLHKQKESGGNSLGAKAQEGLAQSKSLACPRPFATRASVLDCGSPPAALDFNAKAYRPLTIQGCPPCSNEKRQRGWRSPKASPARDLSPLAAASWTAAVPLPLWISTPKINDRLKLIDRSPRTAPVVKQSPHSSENSSTHGNHSKSGQRGICRFGDRCDIGVEGSKSHGVLRLTRN